MRPTLMLAAVALAALPLNTSWAGEGTAATPDTAALLQRLEEQEQRIRVLERRLERLQPDQYSRS